MTVYLLTHCRPGYDRDGRRTTEVEVDPDLGYFTSRDEAERFVNALHEARRIEYEQLQDHLRHSHQAAVRQVRKANRERLALYDIGLRKSYRSEPDPEFTPLPSFEIWLQTQQTLTQRRSRPSPRTSRPARRAASPAPCWKLPTGPRGRRRED